MEVTTITPERETQEASNAPESKTIKLADFLDEWGDILKAQVVRNMNPVYSPKAEDDWDRHSHTCRTRHRRLPCGSSG